MGVSLCGCGSKHRTRRMRSKEERPSRRATALAASLIATPVPKLAGIGKYASSH